VFPQTIGPQTESIREAYLLKSSTKVWAWRPKLQGSRLAWAIQLVAFMAHRHGCLWL